MFLPLLATLAVLGQAPASSEAPLTVLIAPPEAAGVPSHIISFAQEHVAEQLKTQGLQVVLTSDLSQLLSPAQRKSVLGCNRLEPACRITLGEAAEADVVMITELVQFLSGYRVGLKAYATRDGELLAEHYEPGVREDLLLDALTRASERVVPPVLQALRPTQAPIVETPLPELTPVQPPTQPKPELTATRSGPPGWAWVPAAGGAVMLGVGTVFLVKAGQDYQELKDQKFEDLERGAQLKESGQRAQNLSRIAYAVGAAGVVTSGLIYLLSGKDKKEAVEVRPTASVGNGGGMVGLVGTLP
ncbi:hypothetical protein JRI60_45655 [Archangium violaceum]|uniref:hypothetical protein n=1 Tax=Archangium violaceum TaxID=83451 RepID=UPI0019525816|nr:hypothetical protein [Archangium violaceum]QRN96230.1 hypothetical protein JRI60_45655 [Archangium violaceum]